MIADLKTLPERPTDDDLPSDMDCVYAFDHPDECRKPGVVIDCVYCVRPWGPDPKKVRMWTPCCGKIRQSLRHGDVTHCPACGWQWRLFLLGWTSRIVSLGPRPRKKRKACAESV